MGLRMWKVQAWQTLLAVQLSQHAPASAAWAALICFWPSVAPGKMWQEDDEEDEKEAEATVAQRLAVSSSAIAMNFRAGSSGVPTARAAPTRF